MSLQEGLLIAVVLLLVLILVTLKRRPRAETPMAPFLGRWGDHVDARPVTTTRGVLPMSTVGPSKGRGVDVQVYDEEKGTFRRVGLVDPTGKGDDGDTSGDGINLVKGKLYRITGRPQALAFRADRITIGKGSTPGGAADWNVHDITVGGRSQLAQRGVVPGDVFSSDAKDMFVHFETCQTAMDFSMDVAYVGPQTTEPFHCVVVGDETRA